ncbi:MAG: YidC/Oxa1 family membrane protein insertase [Lachnospiraceae bacterium]|nr:YidC/Oxa1 family membrane protein insertase [Lachnospiraceae bacterium]
MTGILLTQSTTPIIGQIAWVLGKLMNFIFNFLNNVFGIQNIGLCIIIFTIIIYTLMIPLTLKQQKFSKLSAVMNPEIQKVTAKYKGKKDQDSMQKMQAETQAIYEKYGTSQVGGCAQMLIQMPILFGLYKVIQNIPAYVDGIKSAYMPLIDQIMTTHGFQKIMETIGKAKPVLINPEKFDYSKVNTLVDVLYKFQTSTWETLAKKFPELSDTINTTISSVEHFNNFFGINIANAPMSIFTEAIKTGAIGLAIGAVCIPILSGITQFLNIKLMPQAAGGADNPMANQMKTMNMTMPLFSVFMCFTLPAGLGLYWIASAVVRTVQQIVINKYLDRQPIEELVKKNVEKANKKREKKGIPGREINEMARKNVRSIDEKKGSKNEMSAAEKEEKIKKATEYYKNEAKPGSLASKASMVKKFNEND